jgi:hypothetical protein
MGMSKNTQGLPMLITMDDLLDTKEFDPGNLLGKVLAFINQVHFSL